MIRRFKPSRPDPARDPQYLSWIRTLPCVVCLQWGFRVRGYLGTIEAAHVGQRGLSQKCPDRETLPLCVVHHRLGPNAVHVLGRNFWNRWKLDRYELIAGFNRRYDKGERKDAV